MNKKVLIAIFITLIFALRWRNCLPLSGYMPAMENSDLLAIYGRYLVFANEPLGFPLGLVNNLGFPFKNTNIAKASIPLFAIPLKILSKIIPKISTFYFFVFFEIIAVFFTAYFTCLILQKFNVHNVWLLLLGAFLISLSPALLFRSSNYYNVSFMVGHFPIYLAFFYFYRQFYKLANWRSLFLLVLVFPIAALVDYYIVFGILVMLFICLSLSLFNFLIFNNKLNKRRAFFTTLALIIASLLFYTTTFILGDKNNMTVPPHKFILEGRYNTQWGYGGGYGGGFHVADVFGLFIPPQDDENVVPWKKGGPSAYLTKIGFPLTTAKLQAGQYEGFIYLGTTIIFLLITLLIVKITSFIKKSRQYKTKLELMLFTKFRFCSDLFSLEMIIGIAAFVLYVISWGYIIHIGGVRFNHFPSLSLIMVVLWRNLMLIRSLGRLAIPFMLFITLAVIIVLNKFVNSFSFKNNKLKETFIKAFILIILIVHLVEVWGYLRPTKVIKGNDILNVFEDKDIPLIKGALKNKKALIAVPALKDNILWSKICYSLTIISKVPISGATATLGTVTREEQNRYNSDINTIIKGNIDELAKKYGDIAIVTTNKLSEEIIEKTEIKLKKYNLNNQDAVILTID